MYRGIRNLCVILGTCFILLVAAWQERPRAAAPSPALTPLLVDSQRWFKGNLHTHSLWSDGDDFPEMIADWYKRHGYDFLALTDHNVLSDGERWLAVSEKRPLPSAIDKYRLRFGSAWVEQRSNNGKTEIRLKPLAEFRSLLEEPGKFLLIPGEEITHSYAKAPVHINAVNLRDVIKPISGDSISETISVNHRQVAEQIKKTGRKMIASLNHPNFGWGIRAEDMILADELRFFEVYNGHPSVRNEGDATHPDCEQLWDIVLALRLGKHGRGLVYALATDDAHAYHAWGVGKVNPGRGWVMVRAPHLSAEAVVQAMQAGDFYGSSGVVLDEVQYKDGIYSLKIRQEPGVSYHTEFVATLEDADFTSTQRLDKEGKALPVTRLYSQDVGKVVARSRELQPRYRLTGKELYVRARIISTRRHPNPYKKGDVEMAWTQPVRPATSEAR